MKKEYKDFIAYQKEILNESSEEKDVIYDEEIFGPQEEPYLHAYKLDLKRRKKYQQFKNKK